MDEDYLSRRRPAAAATISLRAVMGTTILAFLGGAALVGWLAYDGKLQFAGSFAQPTVAAPPPSKPNSLAPILSAPTASAALSPAVGGMDQRLAALEQRLARIDLQTAASEGNTARAEALLVALAVRRAIERGAPLGYLEDQLKLRFGDAQSNSVQILVDAAQRPMTIDRLALELEQLAPALLGTPPNEGAWDRFTRELSGLFVVRRGDAPSARPEMRLDRARLMLHSGQVDAALAEVQLLPGVETAGNWMQAARRFAAAQRALDQIETAALLEPERLKDGQGSRVQQPGPAAPPVTNQDG